MKKENKIKEFMYDWIEPISILSFIVGTIWLALVFKEAFREDIILNHPGFLLLYIVSSLFFITFIGNNESKLNFVKDYIKSEKTFEEFFLKNKDEMIRFFKNEENFLSYVEFVKKKMEKERIMKAKIAEYEAIEAKKLEDKFLGKGE